MEPPPVKAPKPLPKPDDAPRKKRGGRRSVQLYTGVYTCMPQCHLKNYNYDHQNSKKTCLLGDRKYISQFRLRNINHNIMVLISMYFMHAPFCRGRFKFCTKTYPVFAEQ